MLYVAHDPSQFPGGTHRHRNHVLLAAVRGDRIDAGRMRKHLALAGERCRGDLRHHEPRVEARIARKKRRQSLIQVRVHEAVDSPLGDRREIRHCNGEKVEYHRDGLAMKVAAREQRAVVEDQRVVGGRIQFAADDTFRESNGIEDRPVHLRHAAQGVRVLNAQVAVTVGLPNLAVGQQRAEKRGRFPLALLSARIVEARVKCHGRAAERLDRRGTGDVRRVPEHAGVGHRKRRNRRVRLRAVDQRDAFFRSEHERSQPRGHQGGTRRSPGVATKEVTLTDERECEMSQRRKVAAGPDRALLRHWRPEIRVEHRAEKLGHGGPGAGESLRDDVRAQEHHRAHLAPGQRGSDPCGVAADEVHLQLRQLVRRNGHVGQLAESCGHAVGDGIARDDVVHHSPRGGHAHPGCVGERDGRAALRDRAHLREVERTSIEGDRGVGHALRLRRTARKAIAGSIVIKLDVRLRLERDVEREREIAVRSLREAEDRAPVVQLALERNRLRPELVALHVVVRRPRGRPLFGEIEVRA